MRRAWIAAGVALPIAVAVVALAWPEAPAPAAPAPVAGTAPEAASQAGAPRRATGPEARPAAPAASIAVPAPVPATTVADARVPPIDPPTPEPAPAQPWELADPALYQAREKRLAQEMDTRFVQAAEARLPQLRAAVVEMRARRAAPADIARAEDKIRHLEAVHDALVRGEPIGR